MEIPAPGIIAIVAVITMFIYGIGECLWLGFKSKQTKFRHHFSQPLKNIPAMLAVRIGFPFLGTMSLALAGSHLAPFTLSGHWYIWPVALIIYEFWYWVQHFLAHKVRLLWCIHSPHHAPDTMHMFVGYNHHLLEAPYMAFFLGFITALCGVPIEMILVINIVDSVWGSMLHASPELFRRRYGPLEYFLQTPSYHRAHHAQNARYIDTNYNSITLLWDQIMGTRQELIDEEQPIYGITRDVDVESWRDVQFGEFGLLWRDMKSANHLLHKLAYLIMPPGWSHTGHHKTASLQKQTFSESANENIL